MADQNTGHRAGGMCHPAAGTAGLLEAGRQRQTAPEKHHDHGQETARTTRNQEERMIRIERAHGATEKRPKNSTRQTLPATER